MFNQIVLTMFLSTSLFANGVFIYATGNEAHQEIKETIKYVAISEVPIPNTYNVSELDSYCKYDYQARVSN